MVLLRMGLPGPSRYRSGGALLPHLFTLAGGPLPGPAVCFLWHFPWGRPRRALPGILILWSPDFPLPAPQGLGQQPSGHLTVNGA